MFLPVSLSPSLPLSPRLCRLRLLLSLVVCLCWSGQGQGCDADVADAHLHLHRHRHRLRHELRRLCWNAKPSERPSFKTCLEQLEEMRGRLACTKLFINRSYNIANRKSKWRVSVSLSACFYLYTRILLLAV